MTDAELRMLIDAAEAVRAGCMASGLTHELGPVCDVVAELRAWAESLLDNGAGAVSDMRAESLRQAVARSVAVSRG